MGSKDKIAEKIIDFLPNGKRFIDLFGGGGAMSHCALLSGKYEQVLYNELTPSVAHLFRDATAGKFSKDKFIPRWISREEFNAKKDTDGYIRTCWSFGNNGQNYMFHKEIEEIKKKGFEYCVNKRSIDGVPDCDFDDMHDRRRFLGRWAKKQFQEEIKGNETQFQVYQAMLLKRGRAYREMLKEFALRFTSWLRSTGITAKEVAELTQSCMASHYLTTGTQPAIPTAEMFDKLRQSPKIKDIPQWVLDIVYDDFFIKNEKAKLKKKELQRLQSLQSLESLQRLQSLESLESLERLQRLQSLQSLQITNESYLSYKYKVGDVVYCDPPYENTAEYSKNGFDHKAFYDWVANADFPVWFSSYDISDGRFEVVWSTEKVSLLSINSRANKLEKIYANKKAQMLSQQIPMQSEFKFVC